MDCAGGRWWSSAVLRGPECHDGRERNREEMANYTIVRACGHEAQVKARGTTPAREGKLELERQRICRSCAIEKQRLEAEATAEDLDLPALIGTPKQIASAVTLRHKALMYAETYLDYLRESGRLKGRVGRDMELFEAQKERVLEPLKARTEAAWWIDRRHESGASLLESLWDSEAQV